MKRSEKQIAIISAVEKILNDVEGGVRPLTDLYAGATPCPIQADGKLGNALGVILTEANLASRKLKGQRSEDALRDVLGLKDDDKLPDALTIALTELHAESGNVITALSVLGASLKSPLGKPVGRPKKVVPPAAPTVEVA